MPVSPATAEHLAAGVVAHYQDAEAALTARIARNLAKGIDAPTWAADKLAQMQEYERQARRLLAGLEEKARTGVGTAITTAYEQGGLSAVADLSKLQMSDAMKYSAVEWQPTPLRPWVVREPDGRALHKFDTQEKAFAFVDKHPAYMGAATPVESLAGLRAVEALTQETLGNVLATHTGILRSVMDTYRSVIAESSSGVLLGDQTRRQAAQAALNRFAAKGITGFTDKAGRAWSMESYTEMALRTGCGRAAVQGHVDRLTANGLDLVIVSDAPKECPLCRPWEGKVLSIGGVPVEMPEGMDPAFQVDSGAAGDVPGAVIPAASLPFTDAQSLDEATSALERITGMGAGNVQFMDEIPSSWAKGWGKPLTGAARLKSQNDLLRELGDMHSRFPEMPRNAVANYVATGGKSGRAFAPYQSRGKNGMSWSSGPLSRLQAEAWLEQQAKVGAPWHAGGDPATWVADTVRHEYGHALTNQETYDRFVAATQAVRVRTKTPFAITYQETISAYCPENMSEMLAESFSLYTRRGYKSGTMPHEIEEIMGRICRGDFAPGKKVGQ